MGKRIGIFHPAAPNSRSFCIHLQRGPGKSPFMGNYLGRIVSAETI